MARELATALANKGGLTLAMLASYDDVLTDALVDRVYFWSTIRKNRARFTPSRGIQEEEMASTLRDHVIVEKDAKEATDKILQLSGIRKYVDRLRTQDEKEHFQRHLRKYVNMYLPDCPFEVTTTNRYTIDTHEASVTARKDIKKGEVIKYLSGIQVAITEDQFKALARDDVRLDFSIVHSSRKKTPSLFLGPARFANHDCNSNARLSTTGAHGMQILAAKDISIGDEITVTYGTDYFGEDNCECLCSTCERLQRNGWAVRTSKDSAENEDDDDIPEFVKSIALAEGYSLRRKRSADALDDDAGSGVSTPRAGPKRLKTMTPQPSRSVSMTPRGRRSIREVEVKVKTEQSLPMTCVSDVPTVTTTAETHVTATIKAPAATFGVISRKDRMRQLRESSDDSENSRSSSAAASSIYSTLSQSTIATSDGEASDAAAKDNPRVVSTMSLVESVEAPAATPIISTQHLDLDITATTTITQSQPESDVIVEGSNDEATPNSTLLTVPHTEQVSRHSKSQTMKSQSLPREVLKLYEGSMIRSVHEEYQLEAALAAAVASPSLPPTTAGSGIAGPVLTTEIDISVTTKGRRPGDYTLTEKLLVGIYSRYVQCQTCDVDFVQDDAYLTRKDCPRCERHSKLYGFAWPKTDREGRWDPEERILDHRTVHRFVEPDEERKIKKGGRKSLLGAAMRRRESSSAGFATATATTTTTSSSSGPRGAKQKKCGAGSVPESLRKTSARSSTKAAGLKRAANAKSNKGKARAVPTKKTKVKPPVVVVKKRGRPAASKAEGKVLAKPAAKATASKAKAKAKASAAQAAAQTKRKKIPFKRTSRTSMRSSLLLP